MMIAWVNLVGVLLMTDCMLADNPCDDLRSRDYLHIAGRCFYISTAEDNTADFEEAKQHACPTAIRRGRMAVPNTTTILDHLFSLGKEREFRWVGMQPIYNELYPVKWLDNSSAQDVFEASERYGMDTATQQEPLCMAFGNGYSLVMNCKSQIGYICESELDPHSATDVPPITLGPTPGNNWPSPAVSDRRVPPSATDVPPTTARRSSGEDSPLSSVSHIDIGATSSTGREAYKSNYIPLWLVIAICAVAVCLVVGITVLICVCWRKRSRRGSTEDKCKEMSPIATKFETTHLESREAQKPMLTRREHTHKGHLYEIPQLRDPTQSVHTQNSPYSHETVDEREFSPNSGMSQRQGHGQSKSALTCDVYAEVNLEEKNKARVNASGAQADTSDDDYSTSLVENTIYGQ